MDSSGDLEHVDFESSLAVEVKDEVIADDYWKKSSSYLVDMTNANPQDIYSDKDGFNSASPSLIASTPVLDMTSVRYVLLHIQGGSSSYSKKFSL